MYTDDQLRLETAQVLVRAAATYNSTNMIDLSVSRDIGAGSGLKALWNIEVAYAGGTAIQFQQCLGQDTGYATYGVVDQGVIVPLAILLAGAMVLRPIPELLTTVAAASIPAPTGVGGIGSTGNRYYFTRCISTGTFSAGQHSTRVVRDVLDVKHYPGGYTILS